MTVRVLIAGGGIGGLAIALALHAAGIDAEVLGQADEIRELGVGINLLPHAAKELAKLGLLPALDRAGIRTRELIYANRFGQTVWQEPRGTDAGYAVPQLSIHRGKLLGVLHQAVLERLGPKRIHTGQRLVGFDDREEGVVAHCEGRDGLRRDHAGDGLVGADGIHSIVRAARYPDEGPPLWNGTMLWRGTAEWPAWRDGRTMVNAGGKSTKFVFYPIHADPSTPGTRLTNWAIMARTGDGTGPPPRREDWNRPGRLDEVLPLVRERFCLDGVDPIALIMASGTFYEYPSCDRDPLPRWSFGHVTLLGDAAHPMSPVGSNGASQAILDATCLAQHLRAAPRVQDGLGAYDDERRSKTSDIVLANRKGGPEGVIDLVEARAPNGFDDLEAVASHAEREAVVRGYADLAGFSKAQVNADDQD